VHAKKTVKRTEDMTHKHNHRGEAHKEHTPTKSTPGGEWGKKAEGYEEPPVGGIYSKSPSGNGLKITEKN